MSTQVGVIKKFVKTLIETNKTGTEAIDEAFKAVGAVRYDVFKSKFESDKKSYSADYYRQNFSEQSCGIRINNTDTGAITGSDAGGKTTKTAESIVPETAKAEKLSKAEYNSFTKNGLTVNVTYNEKDDSQVDAKFNYSGATYLEKQKLVTRALYNWWIPESLDLINESLGINFTDGRANIKEINIVFDDNLHYSNSDCGLRLGFNYDMGLASEVTLMIDSDLLYNMTADDKNGVLEGGNKYIYSDLYGYGSSYQSAKFTNYLDRLILQAMAEITLKANVPRTKYTEEIGAGLVEIVGGYDDASTGYSVFVEPTSTSAKHYHGYGYMRYLAKNYSDGMPDGVSYNAKKTVLTLTTDYTESTLDLADFASTAKNVNASALKKGIKIIGNALNNSIRGGSGNDSLVGGNGADTLWGGKGNDTLTGGKGNDVFIYSAGKDVITDYASGDKISLGAAGNDSILGGAGNDSLSGGKGNDKLVGGDGNDKIYGGAGNDTLYGGAGNDSLWGNAGADIFLYCKGEGKDVISGFDNSDMLLITGDFSASYNSSKKEIAFKVDSTKNAVTLKDFGSTSTFNVNGFDYKISGSKLVKK